MICLDIFGQRSPWLLLFGDRWTVPDASWLHTRGGSLTALHNAKALWPPKEGMGLLIRVPNICSVPRTLKGRSLLGLDAPLAPVPKAVLHCQSWVVRVSAAGTHLPAARRRNWGIAQVAGVRRALSQAPTHLSVCSRQLKAGEAASWSFLSTHPLLHFTSGLNAEKTTMGVFYSTSQVRKGKRLWDELCRQP